MAYDQQMRDAEINEKLHPCHLTGDRVHHQPGAHEAVSMKCNYAVNLSEQFLARSEVLFDELIHRHPTHPDVRFLLCDKIALSGAMAELSARSTASDEHTTLFLHHSDIDSVLELHPQRNQLGFVDQSASREQST